MNLRGNDVELDLDAIIDAVRSEPIRLAALESKLCEQKQTIRRMTGELRMSEASVRNLQYALDNAWTMDGYQEEAMETAMFGPVDHPSVRHFVSAFAAVGQIAERAKKAFRDHGGEFDELTRSRMSDQNHALRVSMTTAIRATHFPSGGKGKSVIYPMFGLIGEAGEVAGKLLQVVENPDVELTWDEREEILKEVGDVLWYIAAIARELGYDLSHVAEMNINKLRDRRERDVVQGEGDNR